MQSQSVPVVKDAPPTSFHLTDDQCVQRLAELISHKDAKDFDEIVALIGRLAVPIEI